MKIWVDNYNHILDDVIKEFEIVDNVNNAERIILWNDVNEFEQAIVRVAHNLKIPVITCQHGRKGTSKYYPPFNYKIISDKYCCWGQKDKNDLVEFGQNPNKIFITGTTLFSHLKPKKEHQGINIVFSPEHWDKEIDENYQAAWELKRISKKNKWKIITKIIDGHNKDWYQNPVYSNRIKENHLNICAQVLSGADIVIGISESTFELFAQYLDIPVIIMSEWKPKMCNGDERYLTYRRTYSNACKKVIHLKDLEKVIKSQLENPNELKKEREQICIVEGGINIKNPLKAIYDVIKSI